MSLLTLLFSLEGRIRRAEYWLGHLILFGIAGIVFASIAITMRMAVIPADGDFGPRVLSAPMTFAGVVAMLAVIPFLMWANLAIHVKRWHDRDKSGVWVFITLIPVIGPIWSFIECGLMDGTPGRNRFGRSPKGLAGPYREHYEPPLY